MWWAELNALTVWEESYALCIQYLLKGLCCITFLCKVFSWIQTKWQFSSFCFVLFLFRNFYVNLTVCFRSLSSQNIHHLTSPWGQGCHFIRQYFCTVHLSQTDLSRSHLTKEFAPNIYLAARVIFQLVGWGAVLASAHLGWPWPRSQQWTHRSVSRAWRWEVWVVLH